MEISLTFRCALMFLLMLQFHEIMAQQNIPLQSVDTNKLSKEILHEGKIILAQQWTDAAGKHVLITSETGQYTNEKFVHEQDGQDAELFAYHYCTKDEKTELVWKVYDYIKDCPLDMEARFVPNTVRVTDLDKDGICEIWMMYVTVCHGDVSPSDMKLIMYEGSQKFAMRGQNKIKYSPKDYMGGTYKFDKAFTEGPALFRVNAQKLWAKHITGK